jgi:DNA invertase Pin-like site-specific DNA recombinase
MKVALYLRVSTELQNTDLQRDALVKHCTDKGLQYEIFEDFYTGKKMDRPQFQSLMGRIGEFSSVLIWRTDRLSRKVLDSMLIVQEIIRAGVSIVSLSDPFDLSSATGRFMFNIRLAQNQYEVDLISERTVAGLAATKRRGTKLGHAPAPLDLTLIKSQLAAGQRVETIAKRVGLSKSQLYRRLSA